MRYTVFLALVACMPQQEPSKEDALESRVEQLERRLKALEKRLSEVEDDEEDEKDKERDKDGKGKDKEGKEGGHKEGGGKKADGTPTPKGRVEVEGDATRVVLTSGKRRILVPGEVPEGTWTVLAAFSEGQQPVSVGNVEVKAEETLTLECNKALNVCRTTEG